ncbi:hypothetical protein F8M41_005084 [Gigaspora margarita]|uniref:Uncharacterized protein n=1 Tax=Gigaspora margarita TaxID=4874 RepID=A0A8H3XA82_GIGMA|nr:hypothetical protein F8M41_005084 [Gigaspora margarita]
MSLLRYKKSIRSFYQDRKMFKRSVFVHFEVSKGTGSTSWPQNAKVTSQDKVAPRLQQQPKQQLSQPQQQPSQPQQMTNPDRIC